MFLAVQQEHVGTNEGSWHTQAGLKPGRQGAPHTFSTPSSLGASCPAEGPERPPHETRCLLPHCGLSPKAVATRPRYLWLTPSCLSEFISQLPTKSWLSSGVPNSSAGFRCLGTRDSKDLQHKGKCHSLGRAEQQACSLPSNPTAKGSCCRVGETAGLPWLFPAPVQNSPGTSYAWHHEGSQHTDSYQARVGGRPAAPPLSTA